jgi:hypothetical protein
MIKMPEVSGRKGFREKKWSKHKKHHLSQCLCVTKIKKKLF